MAVQKKIHLTIDPDYYDTLKELADYQGIPLATMVKGMVDKQKPIVHALLKAFMERLLLLVHSPVTFTQLP